MILWSWGLMAAALDGVDNTVKSIRKIVFLGVDRSIITFFFMVVVMRDYTCSKVYAGTDRVGE